MSCSIGGIATRDAEGAPLGTAAMQAFLGAPVVPLGAQAGAALVAARRGPIAAPLAPDQSIGVDAAEGAFGLDAPDAELRWEGGPAASFRAARGSGRLAWLAVAPDAAASGADRRSSSTCRRRRSHGSRGRPGSRCCPSPDGPAPATRRDLAAWTLARGAVDASVRRAGPRRLIVEVTNNAQLPVEGLVLRVHLNEPAPAGVRVETTALMQANATLRGVRGAEAVDLALPPLDARRSRAYSLDFESARRTFRGFDAVVLVVRRRRHTRARFARARAEQRWILADPVAQPVTKVWAEGTIEPRREDGRSM